MKIMALTGNEAAAEAMRQINPDVVAAYPITPQTELMHKFAEFVADGLVDTEMVLVESEHSALSATVGASAAGARAMTATSAQGLALMWEILYIAAGLRLPIVMPVINRALSAPINIHGDHSDTMGARDSGWIQIFSENAQEVYDNTIIAIRIAEHPDILLPVMITMDGFIISHTMERVEVLDDDVVKNFVGEYDPKYKLLDIKNPITVGPLDLQDYYFEHKRAQAEAMENAYKLIKEIDEEYYKISGRRYRYVEPYEIDDAEIVLISLGSTAGTIKEVIDELRLKGMKVGGLKIRVYRPFPREEIKEFLSNALVVGVMDRSIAFGATCGPVCLDVKATLQGTKLSNLPIVDYIYGLGGRDVTPKDIEKIFGELERIKISGEVPNLPRYIGVRGEEDYPERKPKFKIKN
ncbi:MAG: pyruvate ferredoxin oxidoreductase [Candidatus Kryptonium sp.]|nr:pyruvate ferredoxin oxidoreductase [Candidatus Kryptonium sp.]MCX7763018.1 pyruvate ferredoxin oxidoreductase [Candidatus Kryptonium sp.]MDW8109915.1 pyruvate ferredoxin oxidoreductase [Candidatus Kryptonium sp.]